MKHNTKRLVRAALIAGIYVALCLVHSRLPTARCSSA